MTDHREAFAACVARIKRHKEKCDYNEPEMGSILWASEQLEEADAQLCRAREALEAIDDSERLSENWTCNGCEHGFKPAKDCHNAHCVDRIAQRLFDAALSSTGPCAHEEEAKRLTILHRNDDLAAAEMAGDALESDRDEWRNRAIVAEAASSQFFDVQKECIELTREAKRLREAVEWACAEIRKEVGAEIALSADPVVRKTQENIGNVIRERLINFAVELRRKAKEG